MGEATIVAAAEVEGVGVAMPLVRGMLSVRCSWVRLDVPMRSWMDLVK
jgi:hypothetical protein